MYSQSLTAADILRDVREDVWRERAAEAFARLDTALFDVIRVTFWVDAVISDEETELRTLPDLTRLIRARRLRIINAAHRAAAQKALSEQFASLLRLKRTRKSSRGDLFGDFDDYQVGQDWDHPEGFSDSKGRVKAVVVHNYYLREPPLTGAMDSVQRGFNFGSGAGNVRAAKAASSAVVIRLPMSWYYPGMTTAFLIVRID